MNFRFPRGTKTVTRRVRVETGARQGVCVCERESNCTLFCRQLRNEAKMDIGTHQPHVVQSHGILRPERMPRPQSADGLVDVLRDDHRRRRRHRHCHHRHRRQRPECWGQGNSSLLLDKKVSASNSISSQRSIKQTPINGFHFHDSCFDLTEWDVKTEKDKCMDFEKEDKQ